MPELPHRQLPRDPDIHGDQAHVHFINGTAYRRDYSGNARQSEIRYYYHKIAQTLLPKEKGEVLNLTSADTGGTNTSVQRTVSAPYQKAVTEYYDRGGFHWPAQPFIDKQAQEHSIRSTRASEDAVRHLFAYGVDLNNHPVNVDVLPDGRPFFFEVENVDETHLRDVLTSEPDNPNAKKALGYLDRLQTLQARRKAVLDRKEKNARMGKTVEPLSLKQRFGRWLRDTLGP